ncbi:MAG: NlpC/P60 family protein [Fimbriimonadales bacterium]|nr:NlpC/P60 family protein [Fimbriimonadales bacterium]
MSSTTRLGLIALLVSLIVAASARQQTITYTVQSGDSLYLIARKHGVRLSDLLKVNKLRNPHALQIRDKIKIPLRGASSRGISTQSASPASGWAEVNADGVNLRRAPRLSAKRLKQLDRGTKVQVLKRQGDWSRVRLASGRVGWVKSRYLTPTRPPRAKQVATASKRRALQERAGVRSPSRAAALADASDTLPNPVRRALSYLGVRYRYGGSSSRGFDCSGFTMYIYRRHGILLPHSASAQYRLGKPVSRSELRPGDLVFFRTRGRRISHVGIYIGDGKFVHASSSRGRVRIDTLDSGYYKQRYVGARRIIP